MKLLTLPNCPLGRQVRIAARDRSITLDLEWVGNGTEIDGFNPLRRTPVLITDEGTALHDVSAILEYLDTLHEGPPLISVAHRWTTLDRLALCRELVCMISRRSDELHRQADMRSATLIEDLDATIWRTLAWLDERIDSLAAAAGVLTADQIAVACALDFADSRYSLHWHLTFTKASRWLAAIHKNESFAEMTSNQGSSVGG